MKRKQKKVQITADNPLALPTKADGPTRERVKQSDEPVKVREERDPDGWFVKHGRSADVLVRMLANGKISRQDFISGRRFAQDFNIAQLDPMRASSPERIGHGTGVQTIDHIEDAKQCVWDAMIGIGGQATPCGRAIWFIVGCGLSISEWSRRERWGADRYLHPQVAEGILIGSLSALTCHYSSNERHGVVAA